MPCGCDEVYTRNYYQYYDTPDGSNIDKKMMVTTRYGVIAGLILGTYDVLMYSHAVGMMRILERYAKHVVPLGLMGATFALVANGALKARDKDDGLNYFLGGLACGPIAAVYLKSKHAIVAGGIVLGAIGFTKKYAIDLDYTFFPTIPDHMNSVNGWRRDWTMAQDPKDLLEHTCGLKKKSK